MKKPLPDLTPQRDLDAEELQLFLRTAASLANSIVILAVLLFGAVFLIGQALRAAGLF